MKKIYISPAVEAFEIQATTLMAASLGLSDTPVNTSEADVQLGRENNSNSSLWDQEW